MWINGSSKEYFECKAKFAELKEFAEKLNLPKAIDEGIKNLTHQLNWYAEFYEKWHIDTDVHSITYGRRQDRILRFRLLLRNLQ